MLTSPPATAPLHAPATGDDIELVCGGRIAGCPRSHFRNLGFSWHGVITSRFIDCALCATEKEEAGHTIPYCLEESIQGGKSIRGELLFNPPAEWFKSFQGLQIGDDRLNVR